jgi:uncharacterized oligopeptide transporter (OPT) family protein
MKAQGIEHAIGSERFPAPQATLMATLLKGILSFNLDWQYVMVGVFIAIMIELCNIKALAFAIGLYLPLATTLPIFIGGAIKGLIDWKAEKSGQKKEEDDLGKGSLFATGLIAGGAIAGVIVALLSINDNIFNALKTVNLEEVLSGALGHGGYQLLGAVCFALMGFVLYRIACSKTEE